MHKKALNFLTKPSNELRAILKARLKATDRIISTNMCLQSADPCYSYFLACKNVENPFHVIK